MCTVLLPPGVNPIAVNKYINILMEVEFCGQIFAKYIKLHENPPIGRPVVPCGQTNMSNPKPLFVILRRLLKMALKLQ